MTNLNELAKEIHENAVAHGWWEEERSFPEIIALVHSELSEALEEYRSGSPMIWHKEEETATLYAENVPVEKITRYKPEGIAVELADAIIRILDYCGMERLTVPSYNGMRAYRIRSEGEMIAIYSHGAPDAGYAARKCRVLKTKRYAMK